MGSWDEMVYHMAVEGVGFLAVADIFHTVHYRTVRVSADCRSNAMKTHIGPLTKVVEMIERLPFRGDIRSISEKPGGDN